jgi:hypothetical protein
VTLDSGGFSIVPEVMLLAGDIDGSGTIDTLDLDKVAEKFNTMVAEDEPSDINGDGIIDIYDLVWVGKNFGES